VATLTEFLIALSNSSELRDRYNDASSRDDLLREWDLERHPALQPGATIEEMRSAVAGEPDVGEVPDWWILVDGDPIAVGDSWILAVEGGPNEPPVS
jgi:hypothetical protein